VQDTPIAADEGTFPFVTETKNGIIFAVGPGVDASVEAAVGESVGVAVGTAVGGTDSDGGDVVAF
jgi:hypothetical protein